MKANVPASSMRAVIDDSVFATGTKFESPQTIENWYTYEEVQVDWMMSGMRRRSWRFIPTVTLSSGFFVHSL